MTKSEGFGTNPLKLQYGDALPGMSVIMYDGVQWSGGMATFRSHKLKCSKCLKEVLFSLQVLKYLPSEFLRHTGF